MRVALAWTVIVGALAGGAVAAAACSSDSVPSSTFIGPPGTTTGPPIGDTNPPDEDHFVPPPPPPPEDGALPVDAGVDAPVDAPPARTLLCPTAACPSNQVCCAVGEDGGALGLACMAQCPGGQFPVSCDGRDQCATKGKSFCCALLNVGAGTPPRCPYTGGFASCTDSCSTSFAMSCPANTSVKPCHAASDCVGDPAGETNCCVFGAGPLLTFCVADNLKVDGGTCL